MTGTRALPPNVPGDWRHRAARRGKPVAIFYDGHHQQAALDTCRDCPVIDACLEWALTEHIDFGVLGGLSVNGRRRILRRRRQQLEEAA